MLIMSGTYITADSNTPSIEYLETKRDLRLSGTIKGYGGELINKATILIPELSRVAESDEQGFFELLGIPPGKYRLEISAKGYMDYRSDVFELKESSRTFIITLMKVLSEEIVVTATRTPKLYMEVPVKTQVISARQIDQKQATQLAEAIALTTGVRVENNCQNCNFTQVRINGMEGKYSQILIDNSPLFSSMIGVYGLEQIPSEMINRIEIVKGGGSALYGGNAVAGVINVQTKEPMENSSTLNLHQETISGKPFSNAGFRTSLISEDGNTKGFLFANFKERQPVDLNDDDFSEIGKLRSTNFGLNLYNYFPDVGGKIKFSFYRITENRRGGNKFDLPPHDADTAESINTNINGLSGEWNHFLSTHLYYNIGVTYVDAKRETYYGSGQDLNAYGSSKNPVVFWQGQMNYQAGKHLLSAGLQSKGEKIKDQAVGYGRVINDSYYETGLFVQDDVKFNRTFSLLAGMRISKHSLLDNIVFNPRLSLLTNVTKDLSWRATFSTGFRAPQVFDEDLHITQVGGEGMIIENSPALKQESSFSITTGLDFGHIQGGSNIQVSLEGFFTILTDTFILTEKEDDPRENALVFERINGSNSKVYGISAEFGYRFNSSLSFIGGMTFQHSRLEKPEPFFGSMELFRSPESYGYASLNYENQKIVNIDISLEYTGQMKVPHYAGYIAEDRLETSKPFLVLNARIKKPLILSENNSIKIMVGVFNLFNGYQSDLDLGINRDAGYVYGPSKPRSLYLGFEFSF
ncbi:MAG: TonB-dependent receptor [Candidatus Aminicenantes bacterium]|nr:TonB-dependent receptor [Candidatus Aminicenantes bacterium]